MTLKNRRMLRMVSIRKYWRQEGPAYTVHVTSSLWNCDEILGNPLGNSLSVCSKTEARLWNLIKRIRGTRGVKVERSYHNSRDGMT